MSCERHKSAEYHPLCSCIFCTQFRVSRLTPEQQKGTKLPSYIPYVPKGETWPRDDSSLKVAKRTRPKGPGVFKTLYDLKLKQLKE